MAMVKADHQQVKALFDQYEAAGDRKSKPSRRSLQRSLRHWTSIRTSKKPFFILWSTLMEDMQALEPGDAQYAAKFTVVMERVRQHMAEEEGEMFPRA
jgi:hypothetical protein